jgi:Amidohydrolase family
MRTDAESVRLQPSRTAREEVRADVRIEEGIHLVGTEGPEDERHAMPHVESADILRELSVCVGEEVTQHDLETCVSLRLAHRVQRHVHEERMSLLRTVFAGGAVALSACASLQEVKGPAEQSTEAHSLLALRGRIIDGTGAAPIEQGVVLAEGERVLCVGTPERCPVPAGATVLDAGGGTILPGLIDLHVHARAHYLPLFLPAGVTSVRDANNSLESVDALLAVAPHRPRVFWSGPMLDGERTVTRRFGAEGVMKPGAGDIRKAFTLEATSAAEARAAVNLLADRGANVIKLYEQLSPEAFAAAVQQAKERKVPTMTDLGIQGTRGLKGAEVDALQALQMGVGSIEHASGFALAYQRMGGDPLRLPLDPARLDTLARAVVDHGAALVPTLTVTRSLAMDDVPSLEGVLMADRLDESFFAQWKGVHEHFGKKGREAPRNDLAMSRELLRRVSALGGLIGAGTDSPAGAYNVPGGGLHEELELLVEAGLTPLQAVQAATGNAGRILGRPDLGTLAPGMVADILIVEGNPAADIRATRGVRTVVLDGKVLPMEELLRQAPPVRPAARGPESAARDGG